MILRINERRRPPPWGRRRRRRLCVLCFCSFIFLYYEYLWIFLIYSLYIPYIYVLNIFHIFSFVCFVIYSANRFKSNFLIRVVVWFLKNTSCGIFYVPAIDFQVPHSHLSIWFKSRYLIPLYIVS